MTLTLNTAARNAAVDALVGQANTGGAGTIAIYTGTQPTDPSVAATGTLLVTLTLPNPAFGAAASGTANLNTVAAVNAVATGTAGWFRIKGGGGVAVMDGAVGTSGTELTLNSTAVTSGGAVTITGGTVTLPAS